MQHLLNARINVPTSRLGAIAAPVTQTIRRAATRIALKFWLAFAIALYLGTGGIAQADEDRTAVESTSQAALKQQQAECEEQLARLRRDASAFEESGTSELPLDLVREIELWTRLDLILAQRRSLLGQLSSLEGQRESWSTKLDQLRRIGPAESRPYSFLLLDRARSELEIDEERAKSTRQEIVTERAMLAAARDRYDNGEANRRKAREDIDSTGTEGRRDRDHRRLELAELASRVNDTELGQRRERLELLKRQVRVSEDRIHYLRARVEALADGVRFSQDDLNAGVAEFDRNEAMLRMQLASVRSRLRRQMHDQLTQSPTADEETSMTDAPAAARRQIWESVQLEAQLLEQILSELVVARETWRRRYALVNSQPEEATLATWLEEATSSEDRLDHVSKQIRLRVEQLQREVATLPSGSNAAGETNDESSQPQHVSHRQDLQHLSDAYNEALVLIERGKRLHGRFRAEIQEVFAPSTAGDVFARLGAWTVGLWQLELLAIDDRPITVGKIISGLGLAAIGFFLARLLSRVVGRRLLPRIGVDTSASTAIQTVVFYALVLCFTFVSLELVHVPLTVFAFLGGAVAIGIGFGSQNILNNFISGLILLAERPIRIGDLVNVEGIDATIEHIGARSTSVRSGDNRDILVPNSKFLENNVTNWTLSDTRIRKKVTVGVAYGSPARRVSEVLHDIVRANPRTLRSPDPIVLFQDFGDSALIFEVHFWIHMRTIMEGAVVESEVRHAIDEAFHEEKITIAFPQRDVHLDVSTPLGVRLLESNEPSKPDAKQDTASDDDRLLAA